MDTTYKKWKFKNNLIDYEGALYEIKKNYKEPPIPPLKGHKITKKFIEKKFPKSNKFKREIEDPGHL